MWEILLFTGCSFCLGNQAIILAKLDLERKDFNKIGMITRITIFSKILLGELCYLPMILLYT
jgi:hypothetical protein